VAPRRGCDRFAELDHQVKFSEALALLRQWRGIEYSLLHEAARFYRIQLHCHPQRGGCVSVPTRTPFLGDDRAHADRAPKCCRCNTVLVLISLTPVRCIGANRTFLHRQGQWALDAWHSQVGDLRLVVGHLKLRLL
jgi:hypothetical protein